MGVLETLKPIIKMVMQVMYAVYFAVGLAMFCIGAYYYATITDPSASIFLACTVVGFVMIFCGGTAIWATLKENDVVMGICLFVNLVLFITLLGATIVALFIVNDVEDPVEHAVTKVYTTSSKSTEARQTGWSIVVQSIPRGAPIACKQLRDSIDLVSLTADSGAAVTCTGSNDGSMPAACFSASPEGCEVDDIAIAGDAATACTLTPMAHAGATPASCVATTAGNAVVEACTMTPGTAAEETTAATTCTLTAADAAANPAVVGSCAVATGSGTCAYTAVSDDEVCAAVTGMSLDDAIECEHVLTPSTTDAAGTKACTYTARSDAVDGSCAQATAGSGVLCTYVAAPTCNLRPDESACADNTGCNYTASVVTPCALNTAADACAVNGGSFCAFHPAGSADYLSASKATIVTNYQGATYTAEGGDSTKQGKLAGNCSLVHELMDGEAGVQTVYLDECNKCWADFQAYTTDQIKAQLWPATYVTGALLFFVVILLIVNIYMVNNCELEDEEGGGTKWKPMGPIFIVGCVFNGIVLLFGFLTIIAGFMANSDLNEGCKETLSLSDGGSCVNWACVGVIVLGCMFFVVSLVSTGAMVMGGFLGQNMVRVANICFVVLALFLMITGIAFAIVAGAITSINEEYDLKFDTIRTQYEQQDCNVCADPPDLDNDQCYDMRWGNSRCRNKIKLESQERMATISVVLGAMVCGFVVVLYITLQAVKIYGEDDESRESEMGEEIGDDD